MTILEKFMVLIKRAEGTDVGADRGILSDYMTTLNNLIDYIWKHRDDINAHITDKANVSSFNIYLKEYIINY